MTISKGWSQYSHGTKLSINIGLPICIGLLEIIVFVVLNKMMPSLSPIVPNFIIFPIVIVLVTALALTSHLFPDTFQKYHVSHIIQKTAPYILIGYLLVNLIVLLPLALHNYRPGFPIAVTDVINSVSILYIPLLICTLPALISILWKKRIAKFANFFLWFSLCISVASVFSNGIGTLSLLTATIYALGWIFITLLAIVILLY